MGNEFLKGVQVGNQTNTDNRQQKQIELQNYIKGFEKNANGDYRPNERGQAALDLQSEKVNQQLTYLQEQNKMMQSTLNERSMTEGVKQLTLGNVKDGWNTIQRNKPLAETLKAKGVVQVAPVDWYNDKELFKSNMNITPEMLQDPKIVKALNSSFTKVQGPDGTWKLSSTENLVQASGTLGYLPSADKDGMIKRFNTLGQILNGRVLTSAEQRAKDAQTTSIEATSNYATTEAEQKNKDIEAFFSSNPNATWGDYLQTQVKYDAKTANNQLKYEAAVAEQEAKVGRTDFLKGLKTKETFDDTDTNRAEILQGKNKMTDKERENTYGKFPMITGFTKLNKELASLKESDFDRNAITKIQGSIASVFGTNFTPGDENEILKNIDVNTKMGAMIAKYVKYMSGAAVTEGEREMYANIVQSGNWSNLQAMTVSMRAFTDGLLDDTKASIDGYSEKYPYDYILLRSNYDDLSKAYNEIRPEEEWKQSGSNGRSSNPFRTNGRAGGQVNKAPAKVVNKPSVANTDNNSSALDLSQFDR